ncbi:MAG: methylthioribulose 1-phosphate dehydratase [Candidatus Omnitrophica bacterium]|nr:methylthioribulose 1-phosphate dehydratase [Candidatus Omnitrophota bacterium]
MIETLKTENIRELICQLCRQFYLLGWVSGTGGGISIRDGDRIYMAPSGVQKERIEPEDLYVLDLQGNVVEGPQYEEYCVSACKPLFMNAYHLRNAGAVIHSHSLNAMLATLISGEVFRVTGLEMMKGIEGMNIDDTLEVPVIGNTPHESQLTDSMARAMREFPKTQAVLVKGHGVYIWGKDWKQAKTQAECYDYLFAAAVQMRRLQL